jgi:hypothetical protein
MPGICLKHSRICLFSLNSEVEDLKNAVLFQINGLPVINPDSANLDLLLNCCGPFRGMRAESFIRFRQRSAAGAIAAIKSIPAAVEQARTY